MGFVCLESAHHIGRPIFLFHRWHQILIALALVVAVVHARRVEAQETPSVEPTTEVDPAADVEDPPEVKPAAAATTDPAGLLRFSFDGARWRDVIKWLADESNLALHIGDLPTGSFTYSDPDSFTFQEAIDRVNLFLLPQGFTLVRSGRLLSVINLADPRSMQQLDVLAKLVTIDQLDQLENYQVVKCIFLLGELNAADAVEELSALKLMTTPAVFPRTNQLLITDTAGKLKNAKAILGAFEPSTLGNGTVVMSFALQHVDAEDILVVARPHLGLATGEMIGIDVSLSADLQGKNIFVTGIEDKVKLIEGLVTAIDKPQKTSATSAESELRSHIVEGGNVELVYSVLQTLLADKSVRLSMDETASSIVALATPEVQAEIAQTVSQLQAAEAEFEVIQLKTVDPHFVVSLLKEMLDLPDPLDDPEDVDPDAPRIDADPGNMRLFVRAKKQQIEQIKRIVAGLDVNSSTSRTDKLRIFLLSGKQAEQVLETAAKFWRAPNPIILFRSAVKAGREDTERVLNGESTQTKPRSIPPLNTPNARLLTTDNINGQAPAIQCQLTPRGLLLQSDDTQALDQFEEHLRTIAGPFQSMPSPPVVFYLKYAKPDDAIRVLAELLDGGESAKDAVAGSLINGYVTSSGAFLTSFVTSRDGTTTLIAGTITVVADSRLNRLIAQGTASDIELIEDYLRIIDKDSSITSIETYGTSHVIELIHINASEVAAVIRDAYAGRVAGATGSRQSNQSGSSQQGQREAAASQPSTANQEGEAKKSMPKKQANQLARNLEPQMTIAVHEPSNTLIVTAPDQLFKEVEQLVKLMDVRSEQTIGIMTATNGAALEMMLQRALSGTGSTSGTGTTSGGRTESSPRPPSARPPSPKLPAPASPPFRNRNGR